MLQQLLQSFLYNALMKTQNKFSKHDLTGKVFGRFTVKRFSHYGHRDRSYYWVCLCLCGSEKTVKGASLKSGSTKSCGCLQREYARCAGDRTRTHGLSKTKIYSVWDSMRQRCTNKNRKDFKSYGGRGISVCKRWDSFELFLEDMGMPPEGMTLERRNVNGDYEPLNCYWATTKQQSRNTQRTIYITANGKTKSLPDWAEDIGISYETLSARLRRGWNENDAINTPVDKRFSRTNVLRDK